MLSRPATALGTDSVPVGNHSGTDIPAVHISTAGTRLAFPDLEMLALYRLFFVTSK
jgi:hypothetical protein